MCGKSAINIILRYAVLEENFTDELRNPPVKKLLPTETSSLTFAVLMQSLAQTIQISPRSSIDGTKPGRHRRSSCKRNSVSET